MVTLLKSERSLLLALAWHRVMLVKWDNFFACQLRERLLLHKEAYPARPGFSIVR